MAALKSLDVELEAVTPLWIGGADRQAELRPPTMRGCLRYWFRALAGGLLQESLPEISAAESAVFGGTTRASSIVVRLFGSPRIGIPIGADPEPPPGLGYMFWSVLQQKRDAILPGERFRLRMTLRPLPFPAVIVAGRTLEKADCFELAAVALWLTIRLGGVGARGRRAGGGMRAIAEAEGWPARLPPLVSRATSPAELATELGEGIKRLRQVARWQARPPTEPSSFDILHERVCQIYLASPTFDTWWEAANWAGELFRAFRVEHKMDATAIAMLLTQGRMAARTVVRALLGLPIAVLFQVDLCRPGRARRRPPRGTPQGLRHRGTRAGPGPSIPGLLPRRPSGRQTRCATVC